MVNEVKDCVGRRVGELEGEEDKIWDGKVEIVQKETFIGYS